MGRQLVTGDEATPATRQHKKPCSDCPFARTALRGWLGSLSSQDWVTAAHRDDTVDCHTLAGAQCAGMAIFRSNVCKLPRPPNIVLDHDVKSCFANDAEFLKHHSIRSLKRK